jgi:hypothetical protein
MNKQSHFEPKPTLRASSVFAARPHFDAVAAVAVAASDSETGQGQSHCRIASDNKFDVGPGRFEWIGLCFMVMTRTRGRHHQCVGDESGPDLQDAGTGARRPSPFAATAAILLTGPAAGPPARRAGGDGPRRRPADEARSVYCPIS